MIYDYIIENYDKDEPIFLSELPGNSKNYLRQEMKQLVDDGKIERLYNGVYFLAYTTILGTKGKISIDKFIEKKYTQSKGETTGYITGIQLANMYGFTTQNPACIEVCSNEATTKQRKIDVDGRKIIVYKPLAEITKLSNLNLKPVNLEIQLKTASTGPLPVPDSVLVLFPIFNLTVAVGMIFLPPAITDRLSNSKRVSSSIS